MVNLFNSKICGLYINKLSFKKKKKKLKPNILFFLILSKIRPIVVLIKIKTKKQKNKSKVKRIPKSLNFYNGYKKSVQLFLLPFFLDKKKNYRFNVLLENCFFVFLNKYKKNLAILRKKKLYLH